MIPVENLQQVNYNHNCQQRVTQGSHGMIENKPGGALSLVPWKRESWVRGRKMTKKAKAAIQENGKRPAFPNQRSIMSLSLPDYQRNLDKIAV